MCLVSQILECHRFIPAIYADQKRVRMTDGAGVICRRKQSQAYAMQSFRRTQTQMCDLA